MPARQRACLATRSAVADVASAVAATRRAFAAAVAASSEVGMAVTRRPDIAARGAGGRSVRDCCCRAELLLLQLLPPAAEVRCARDESRRACSVGFLCARLSRNRGAVAAAATDSVDETAAATVAVAAVAAVAAATDSVDETAAAAAAGSAKTTPLPYIAVRGVDCRSSARVFLPPLSTWTSRNQCNARSGRAEFKQKNDRLALSG